MKVIDIINKKANKEGLPIKIKLLSPENIEMIFNLTTNKEYICLDYPEIDDKIFLSILLVDDLMVKEIFENDYKREDILNFKVEIL